MIRNLSEKVASVFVSQGISADENRDIYTYALESVIGTIANVFVALAVSFLMQMPLEGVIFTFSFALLRKFTGGHHAKTHTWCIFSFSCILAITLLLLRYAVKENMYLYLAFMLSSIAVLIVFIFTPVEHKNKHIPQELRRKLKINSRVIVVFLWIISVAGTYCFRSKYSVTLSFAMFSVGISVGCATLSNYYTRRNMT